MDGKSVKPSDRRFEVWRSRSKLVENEQASSWSGLDLRAPLTILIRWKSENEKYRTSRNFGRPSFIPPNNRSDIRRAPPLRTNRWWLLKSPSIIHRSSVLCHAYPLVNQPWKNKKWGGKERRASVYCAPRRVKSLYEVDIEINLLLVDLSVSDVSRTVRRVLFN